MSSWSYSQLSTALVCLQKYKLMYVDKINSLEDPSGDLIFGSCMHTAINSLLLGQDIEIVKMGFHVYWESVKDTPADYGRSSWKKLDELGFKFIDIFNSRHLRKYELQFGETRLDAGYEGVRLEGTLDFYGQYEGKSSLRDFKTSGFAYDKETKPLMALQLYLYTYLAIRNGLKVPETLGYTVFNKSTGYIQDLTWDFNEKEMYKALDEMVKYCDIFDRQKEYPKNYNGCMAFNRKCEYWSKCYGK